MYITYHSDVSSPCGIVSKIPHQILCKDVQDYIEARVAIQSEYYFNYNGMYLFIYLGNGDRIDCALS